MGNDDDLDGEGASPSSLIPVHKLSTPDPLYDLQLLRDLTIINERTVRELGALPAGDLPMQKKSQNHCGLTQQSQSLRILRMRMRRMKR